MTSRSLPPLRTLLADAALCLAFFTRLPVPLPERPRSLADAFWAASLAGLVVALLGWLAYTLAVLTGLSGGSAAALALLATILVTGALHEDGLADTADGFGGGATSERKLEIMRDSRIGTYGALALGLSLLLRWSAIADLGSPIHVLYGLTAAHAASRALLPAYMRLTPSARIDGLAARAGVPTSQVAASATLIGAAALLLLGIGAALATAICLALALVLFCRFSAVQIGGHTGDTAGALQQIGEIITLTVAAALFY